MASNSLDPKALAYEFIGYMVAHPGALKDWDALKDVKGRPRGCKSARDVAKFLKKHLGVAATDKDAAAMGDYLKAAVDSIRREAGSPAKQKVISTFSHPKDCEVWP